MSVALPEAITNKVLAQICGYIETKEVISEFTKKQIKRDLTKLPDDIAFEVCSAFYEVACGEVTEGLSRFNKAYLNFGQSVFIFKNHLFVLGNFGKNILRQETAYYYANDIKSIEALLDAILTASQYGDVDNLKKFLDMIAPMEVGLEKSKSDVEYAKVNYNNYIDLYKKMKIDKNDVQKVLHKALAILEKNNLDYITSRLSSWDGESFDIELSVDTSLEKISLFNEEILDIMIDEGLPSKIVPHFTYPFSKGNKGSDKITFT
jgi:hypothetical protein